MASTPKNIIPPKFADSVLTQQYVADGVKTIIDACAVTNSSAGAATITIHIVPSGGTAGLDNAVVSAQSIAPGGVFFCPGIIGQTLESGASIWTLASAASALVINASGREIA